MVKQLSAAVIGLLLMVAGAKGAIAETVMEKVARTGTLTLGVNLNNVPYSYVNEQDKVVGYSLDVADRIRAEVAKQLGRDVTLVVVESTDVTTSIPKLQTGEVDLVCDTAFTWERDKYVDFTVSYGVTGIKMLLPEKSPIQSAENLRGRRIAVVPNSVAEKTLKLVQPQVQIVPVTNLQGGVEALKAGTVDGVVGDGLQLDGWRQILGVKNSRLAPEKALVNYGIGCMVRHHNPTFLHLANYAIVKLAEGYYYGDPEDVALVDKWVGAEGVVKVDPQVIKNFFNYLLMTHEQIPEGLQASPKP